MCELTYDEKPSLTFTSASLGGTDVYDDEEHDQDEQPYLSAYDVRRQDVTTQYLSQREIG